MEGERIKLSSSLPLSHSRPYNCYRKTHLYKLDSRYWVVEQLGFYRVCYTAPSHNEHDPPGVKTD